MNGSDHITNRQGTCQTCSHPQLWVGFEGIGAPNSSFVPGVANLPVEVKDLVWQLLSKCAWSPSIQAVTAYNWLGCRESGDP